MNQNLLNEVAMTSITCHFRPLLRSGGKEGKIFLRVIHNRKVGNITLPFKIYREDWDETEKRVLVCGNDPVRREYIRKVHEQVNKECGRLKEIASEMEERKIISTKALLKAFRSGWHQQGLKGLTNYLAVELAGSQRYRTSHAYLTTLRRLLRFTGKEDCPVEDITEEFLFGFEQSLQRENLKPGTISFYMRNLRAIYNKGIRLGFFTGLYALNPFSKVYTKIPKTEKRALEKNDIRKLGNLLESKKEEKEKVAGRTGDEYALKLFLFAFHAQGMSFVDLAYLKKQDLKDNILTYYRHKTKQYVRVIMTKETMSLLNSIRSEDVHSPYLLPLITDNIKPGYLQYCNALRKQNAGLKRIARSAGLKVALSTHMARHSWATIAKRENVPVSVICESLGHSSLSTTYIYLDSFNASAIKRANQKVERSIRKPTLE